MQPPAGQMRGQHEEPRSAPRAARLSRVFRQGFRFRRRQPGACDPRSGAVSTGRGLLPCATRRRGHRGRHVCPPSVGDLSPERGPRPSKK
jgi:hypothetical protein